MAISGGEVLGFLMVLGLTSVTPQARSPMSVSPGDTSMPVLIGDACPTFSWSEVEGARSYELVVYRLVDERDMAEPLLRQSFAGSVESWTPPLRQCLEPGGRYAWSVRAEGGWSEPRLFEVVGGPSIADVEAALSLLDDYLSSRADPTGSRPEGAPLQMPETELPLPSATPDARGRALTHQSVGAAVPGAAPPTLGTPSLTLDGNLSLGSGSAVFKDDALFLWSNSSNLALGYMALSYPTQSGSFNSAVGQSALSRATTGASNTAVGSGALQNMEAGSENTAVGSLALANGTVGSHNTAVGRAALKDNTGSFNTATGRFALYLSQNADFNTANGFESLRDNLTGHRNTAIGALALAKNIGGFQNTAVGVDALRDRTAGQNNTAIGFEAGVLVAGDNNVLINSLGGGENNTLRIGRGTGLGVQQIDRAFIHGIFNKTVVSAEHQVWVTDEGQLGKLASSRRYKEDIQDQGAASSRLLALRPVAFRFKRAKMDGSQPVEFGLIAEEVAEAFPELVDLDAEGRPESVKYHLLSTLLLNELQKQELRISRVERRAVRAWSLALLLIVALVATAVLAQRGRASLHDGVRRSG